MACLDIVQALQAPYETSVARLLEEYQLDADNLLDAYAELQEILSNWGVAFAPPMGIGSPEDVRVLRAIGRSEFEDLVLREIEEGESQRCEFKQTLCMDVKKNEIGGRPAEECFSDEVALSALKTVAGFLNCSGGTLLVGVRDDGLPISISREFVCTCPKDNLSPDGWELRLRNLIEQYFVDGAAIQAYLQVGFAEIEGATVARISVGARNKLSFIKKSGSDLLYLRISNRTQSVLFCQIEEYFEMRRHG